MLKAFKAMPTPARGPEDEGHTDDEDHGKEDRHENGQAAAGQSLETPRSDGSPTHSLSRGTVKKKTVGVYSVNVESLSEKGSNLSDSSDDSSCMSDDDPEEPRESSAAALIDNAMASVIANRTTAGPASSAAQTGYVHVLSLSEHEEADLGASGSERPKKRGSGRRTTPGSLSGSVRGGSQSKPKKASQGGDSLESSTGGRISGQRKQKDKRSPRRASICSTGSVAEETIRKMFGPDATAHIRPQHTALNRVVRHIFSLDDVSLDVKHSVRQVPSRGMSFYFQDSKVGLDFFHRLRRLATSSPFRHFFMLLTVYVLFGPDLVLLYGSKDIDKPFLILHTIIFFLFLMELVILTVGAKNYAFTLAAALDVLACFSMLGDTFFLADTAIGENSLVGRLRITRLTRVARVARVTRLVPRIVETLRMQKKTSLAKRLLLRRLRRGFQFLDSDQDELVTSFDLKVFYLSIIQECNVMLTKRRAELISHDAPILTATATNGDLRAEQDSHLDFQAFSKVLLNTWLGQDILMYHLVDMQHDAGVWSLTAKLSDQAAIKVCAGILFVIITMNLLSLQQEDYSAQQSLYHVYQMFVDDPSANTSSRCQQIDMLSQDLKKLFLYVNGVTWVNDGGNSACSTGSATAFMGDPFQRVDDIIKIRGFRFSEVFRSCLPAFEDPNRACERSKNVAVFLVDVKDETRDQLLLATISTAVVIVLVLLFIVLFSSTINNFSRTTLHPLRAVVDDMMAISSIELLNTDAEMPKHMKNPNDQPKQIEELVHLQKAFDKMRTAIRSWSLYVPPTVVQKLFTAGIEATIGVSKTLATILFVDVDGFEDACKGMGPKEVNNLLASVLEKIASTVGNTRGTFLEFIGDEVLAVYNTPNVVKNHVHLATSAALQIHQQIASLPEHHTPDGRAIRIRCRCAVHSAYILAGNIGSHRRMKYGLLGDGVNLTARMKGLNSRYNTQTIATEAVYGDEVCQRRVIFRPLDRVAVKGKTEPTTVYEVMNSYKGENVDKTLYAAQKHAEAFVCYHKRKFADARVLFKDVASTLEALPGRCRLAASDLDQPARQMCRRCIAHIRNPPGPEWDGVERLKAKTFGLIEANDDDDDESGGQLQTEGEATIEPIVPHENHEEEPCNSFANKLILIEGDQEISGRLRPVTEGNVLEARSVMANSSICSCFQQDSSTN